MSYFIKHSISELLFYFVPCIQTIYDVKLYELFFNCELYMSHE